MKDSITITHKDFVEISSKSALEFIDMTDPDDVNARVKNILLSIGILSEISRRLFQEDEKQDE